ncbi:MAG: hypothetical protein RLN60_00985 [Phycisphaerales bacterium]
MNGRRKLLIGVLVVLAALVALDRFAPRGDASATAGDGTSLAEEYARKALLLDRQRALVAQADEWRDLRGGVDEAWADVADRLIVAQSVEIAEGALRERLVAIAQAAGLPRPDTRAVAVPAGDEPGPLRVVSTNLQLSTHSWAGAFTLIDRIETDPSMIARVTDVALDGPGTAQLASTLRVTVTVEAVALLADAPTANRGAGS